MSDLDGRYLKLFFLSLQLNTLYQQNKPEKRTNLHIDIVISWQ